MTTSIEDLAARLERLEHLVEERVLERPKATGAPDAAADALADRVATRIWARIPLGAWLRISGPTVAVLAVGFTTLWNAQQATTQRILDLQESTSARILETTDRILEMERSTTDRILEVQNRILELQESTSERLLEMQDEILDMQREGRAERG